MAASPRPLVTKCGVCDSPASLVLHYGSVSCFSCRAFFRRMIRGGKSSSQLCARGSDSCPMDSITRTNCKKCRLKRCLEIGMMPDRVDMVQRKRGRKTEVKAKTVDRTQKEANLDSPQTSEEGDLDFPKSSNDFSPLNTVDLDSSPHDAMSVEMEILVEEHTVSVDIEGLVEECFLEINYSPGAGQRASVFYQDPVFEITFEEEFKIHELVVRKEFLQDSIFTLLCGVPFINSFISSFILTGRKPKDRLLTEQLREGLSQVPQLLARNLKAGGKIRTCLDMFDEYKNVDEQVKSETFRFSLRILELCIKAFVRKNSDKESFRDQHIAAGFFPRKMEELFHQRSGSTQQMLSHDPLESPIYTSPWHRPQDELFLLSTLEQLGSIVKDDVKLGTLYVTLVLATPGAQLSDTAKADPSLCLVQQEMSLLIFRYLKQKLGSSTEANTVTQALLKLIGDLHSSADILCDRRQLLRLLQQPGEEGTDLPEEQDWIPDLTTVLDT